MPFIIEIIYDDAYIESAYYASVVSLSLGAYLVNHLLDSSNTLHHKKDIITIYISKAGVSAIQLIVILILFLYISSGRDILWYLTFVYILKILLQILLIHV